MLPPWPSPVRHSHPCLPPTYRRSMFEGRLELLRPSVRGTPSPTTHSEGLLLRVGTIPCAPTYNGGVVQAWSSIVSGFHNHTNAARRPQRAMQTVLLCKRLQLHIIICTEDVTAARRTLQRVQMYSRDTISSSSSRNPSTSAN